MDRATKRTNSTPLARARRALAAACLIFAQPATSATQAAEVRVAVASNFVVPLRALKTRFERDSDHELLISSGSTGMLYAQIRNGAPFDVLLSADAERPRRLTADNLAERASRATYARGRLVLYSGDPATAGADCLDILADSDSGHIAIANPKIAPYGIAARETLVALEMWRGLGERLVRGENVAQAFHWVETGNARLGFVAMSQLTEPGARKGCSWIVPRTYYAPLEQQLVLLVPGLNNPGARRFVEFMASAGARALIRDMGYFVD